MHVREEMLPREEREEKHSRERFREERRGERGGIGKR